MDHGLLSFQLGHGDGCWWVGQRGILLLGHGQGQDVPLTFCHLTCAVGICADVIPHQWDKASGDW